jgi:hypothetical protein
MVESRLVESARRRKGRKDAHFSTETEILHGSGGEQGDERPARDLKDEAHLSVTEKFPGWDFKEISNAGIAVALRSPRGVLGLRSFEEM